MHQHFSSDQECSAAVNILMVPALSVLVHPEDRSPRLQAGFILDEDNPGSAQQWVVMKSMGSEQALRDTH